MRNPYILDSWVRGECFYGRVLLIDEILNGMHKDFLVIGIRRIGKTSLLRQLESLAPSVFVNLEKTMASLEGITRELRRDINRKKESLQWELPDEVVVHGDAFEILEALADWAVRSKRCLLLLMDESEALIDLASEDPRLLQRLRGVLLDNPNLRTVLAASKMISKLNELTGNWSTSPFLHGFVTHYLPGLTDPEAQALISQSQSSSPVQVEPSLLRQICELTNNHPYLIQWLCNRLWQGDNRLRPIASEDMVPDQSLLSRLEMDYAYLSHIERSILLSVNSSGRASEVELHQTAVDKRLPIFLNGLTELGYLRCQANAYIVGNKFLSWWLQNCAGRARGSAISDAETASVYHSNTPPHVMESNLAVAANAFSQEDPMSGIPSAMYTPIRRALLQCGPFVDDAQLKSVFAHAELSPWRYNVPQASNPADRVDALMAFLIGENRSDTKENGLVLFLRILSERIDSSAECHHRLAVLAKQLEQALAADLRVSPARLEANPQNLPLTFVAADEKLLTCAQAVCRVSVPRIVNGLMERIPTGSGWLATQDLAITCWHVVEARGLYDAPINEEDLQNQIANTLLTFDYRLPAQGSEYSVRVLEHRSVSLDYAVLRLEDRTDKPLHQRGFLALDEDAPLTRQTQLFVIQHPQGQPQQRASGFFVKKDTSDVTRILHSAPTEEGTSGAPVLNVTNWQVVALHIGENTKENLRESTLIKHILMDLREQRPSLHREIVNAQNIKE